MDLNYSTTTFDGYG